MTAPTQLSSHPPGAPEDSREASTASTVGAAGVPDAEVFVIVFVQDSNEWQTSTTFASEAAARAFAASMKGYLGEGQTVSFGYDSFKVVRYVLAEVLP
ncbi:hypothetical protein [Caudoviricetes sp.]|nr:hypothetical protein [Caudoviricetes sp.]